jgi:tetrahedral aminopeptidase
MSMDAHNLLKVLSEAPGPSGHEDAVRELIADLWRPLVDDLRTDAMGSLIAYRRGSGERDTPPSIMAAAHMDEIGLVVTGIEGEFLRIHELGGMDRRTLLGAEVSVHSRRDAHQALPGVIGSRPPHVLPASERQNIPPWHELFVDLGLTPEEVEAWVRVGDHVTLQQPLLTLRNGRVAGKALDNRASVAALTLAIDALSRRQHDWDFYAVATVQEEMGIKGAITSAYGIAPELAIALDVTFAKQHDDTDPGSFELDKGPTLGVGPNFHPEVVSRLRQAAEAEEIAFTVEPLPGSSGTDAWGIQLAREGIPVGLISLPVRYMHQPVETAALHDVERAGRWLASFVAALEPGYQPRWEDEL